MYRQASSISVPIFVAKGSPKKTIGEVTNWVGASSNRNVLPVKESMTGWQAWRACMLSMQWEGETGNEECNDLDLLGCSTYTY
jgi:hypothetical protein